MAPVEGITTVLWIYSGSGDPFTNPLSNINWARLTKAKDLQPDKLATESSDDTYLDDTDTNWTPTSQGRKSAGETSFTLAWKPAESGQQDLVRWFGNGAVLAYKTKYPNGTIDVFRGWVSSLGKAVTAKDTITRSVKIGNDDKPGPVENSAVAVTDVASISLDKSITTVVVAVTTTLNVTMAPASISDSSFRATTTDASKATVTVASAVLTIIGIVTGIVDTIMMTSDGLFVATYKVTAF